MHEPGRKTSHSLGDKFSRVSVQRRALSLGLGGHGLAKGFSARARAFKVLTNFQQRVSHGLSRSAGFEASTPRLLSVELVVQIYWVPWHLGEIRVCCSLDQLDVVGFNGISEGRFLLNTTLP